jgi:hypothetical protein
MGGPSPSIGNVSFLETVTLRYDSAGTPIRATFSGGNAQVTVDDEGSVFTLATGQMTSARFEQNGTADPAPTAPTELTAVGTFDGVDPWIDLAWTDYSNVASVTTPLDTPAAPTSLAARSITGLTWINAAANATSITVERCAGAGARGLRRSPSSLPTATSWTDLGVRSGSTYR